jgi:hypothetical protein
MQVESLNRIKIIKIILTLISCFFRIIYIFKSYTTFTITIYSFINIKNTKKFVDKIK